MGVKSLPMEVSRLSWKYLGRKNHFGGSKMKVCFLPMELKIGSEITSSMEGGGIVN